MPKFSYDENIIKSVSGEAAKALQTAEVAIQIFDKFIQAIDKIISQGSADKEAIKIAYQEAAEEASDINEKFVAAATAMVIFSDALGDAIKDDSYYAVANAKLFADNAQKYMEKAQSLISDFDLANSSDTFYTEKQIKFLQSEFNVFKDRFMTIANCAKTWCSKYEAIMFLNEKVEKTKEDNQSKAPKEAAAHSAKVASQASREAIRAAGETCAAIRKAALVLKSNTIYIYSHYILIAHRQIFFFMLKKRCTTAP